LDDAGVLQSEQLAAGGTGRCADGTRDRAHVVTGTRHRAQQGHDVPTDARPTYRIDDRLRSLSFRA
jgi:hypothetical protein